MTEQLSKKILSAKGNLSGMSVPGPEIFNLPEAVLQFGTGVLLRALPDYFIDKANKAGVFNGRIVVVKSTDGDTGLFASQDNMYTHCVRGISNGIDVKENIINASISRVLSANTQWEEILACAANPAMRVVISNTTEVGITLSNDNINSSPPQSFPGKLLAFLYRRYQLFKGDKSKGMVIIPTELITDNGDKLLSIVIQLAEQNELDAAFTNWLKNSNYFCNSLVDRIVPNVLSAEVQQEIANAAGYRDELLVVSETYKLWAIQAKDPAVKEILTFAQADGDVVIEEDIEIFRELKLRLLNGSHTFNCALGHFAGFETVREAMGNNDFLRYVQQLMLQEICPSITHPGITSERAEAFSFSVLERFQNPYINQKWLSITLHYSLKMRARNIPLIKGYFEKYNRVSQCMALGFASFLLFMKCEQADGKYYGKYRGEKYMINDEQAGYFSELWMNLDDADVVKTVLANKELWGVDLNTFNGFADAITGYLKELSNGNVVELISNPYP